MSIKSSLSFLPHIKATESPRDAKEATYNNHKQYTPAFMTANMYTKNFLATLKCIILLYSHNIMVIVIA